MRQYAAERPTYVWVGQLWPNLKLIQQKADAVAEDTNFQIKFLWKLVSAVKKTFQGRSTVGRRLTNKQSTLIRR